MHGYDFSVSTVPAFLVKLWKIVEDPSTDDLISWNEDGTSFIIKDQSSFAKKLLPKYYKHNNVASFIRQLNMYDFRKVMNPSRGSMQEDGDEVEFRNVYFIRDQVALLEHIKRKNAVKGAEPARAHSTDPQSILTDLSSIQEKQESMNNLLNNMKKENELLWRELSALRKKHKTQEQIIQRVVQFLVGIVQNGKQNIGMKHQITRMLLDNKSSDTGQGNLSRQLVRGKKSDFLLSDSLKSPNRPVIHEVIDGEQEEPFEAFFKAEPNTSSDNPVSSPFSEPDITSRLSVLSSDSNGEEEVFGLPVNYVTFDEHVPDIASVISISEDSNNYNNDDDHDDAIPVTTEDICNTISILEDSPNIISLPKSSDFVVTDGSNLSSLCGNLCNVISIPDSTLAMMQPSTSKMNTTRQTISGTTIKPIETTTTGSSSQSQCSDLIPYTFMSTSPVKNTASTSGKSLLRPRVTSLTLSPSKEGKKGKVMSTMNDPMLLADKPGTTSSNDLQLAISDLQAVPVSGDGNTKNVLSSHISAVDDLLYEALKLDTSTLLGLFSTDTTASTALANHLTNDNSVLKEADVNTTGNELAQFYPPIDLDPLDVDFFNYVDLYDTVVNDPVNENDQLGKNDPFENIVQSIKRDRMDCGDDEASKVSNLTDSALPAKKLKTAGKKPAKGRRKSKAR